MNADVITIMGSNMAENHPVGFQWVMEARERGATVVHIDPRFTRTSAMATKYIGIRAGTDIAFLGGVLRGDRKSTRLNSSHRCISYAVFCLKKKKKKAPGDHVDPRTSVAHGVYEPKHPAHTS